MQNPKLIEKFLRLFCRFRNWLLIKKTRREALEFSVTQAEKNFNSKFTNFISSEDGVTMNLSEFIAEKNKRISETTERKQMFDNLKPYLIREFDKRNLIITPMQGIMMELSSGLIGMGGKLIAIQKAMKQIEKEWAQSEKGGQE